MIQCWIYNNMWAQPFTAHKISYKMFSLFSMSPHSIGYVALIIESILALLLNSWENPPCYWNCSMKLNISVRSRAALPLPAPLCCSLLRPSGTSHCEITINKNATEHTSGAAIIALLWLVRRARLAQKPLALLCIRIGFEAYCISSKNKWKKLRSVAVSCCQ